ncbi:hypothetical protein GCM10022223_23210 [Kineosporia mesophila]|uniref:Major facilitator superfamily (MFS) profile domain-containing protein n=1 Tax=Kineosporia mesophila TaxID=566012 RepID=A0ABP6ZE09_9ACTN|nr:MFS transporter [Kineosporia mesophila]MCD5350404.1 MFS transporter [Kineosporia mesophila]
MLDPVRRALLALAVCTFGLGTGEYVVVGLLPAVASDLDASVPQIGHLVSAYALGVVIGAPLLAAASVRFPRKGLLISLVVALAAGNLLSAAMPDFHSLLAMRFLSGLPHGAFFGLASVQAAQLVPPARRSQAMAVVFAGLTIANVVGVPLATYTGQHATWRLVFVLIAVVELIGALGVLAIVPRSPRIAPGLPDAPNLRRELNAFRNRQIWLSLVVAVIGCGGIHATFSYISPMMTEVAGYGASDITPLLVLFGLGMTFGNLVGARLADRYDVTRVIYGVMTAQVLVSAAFYFGAGNRVASAFLLFLFPFCNTMAFPALQNRIISMAGDAPNLAAAGMHAAFNIANSLGAWLGGATIAAGWGYNSPNLVAVGLGLIAALIAWHASRTRYSLTSALPPPHTGPGADPARPVTAPIRIPVVGLNTNPIPVIGRYSNTGPLPRISHHRPAVPERERRFVEHRLLERQIPDRQIPERQIPDRRIPERTPRDRRSPNRPSDDTNPIPVVTSSSANEVGPGTTESSGHRPGWASAADLARALQNRGTPPGERWP